MKENEPSPEPHRSPSEVVLELARIGLQESVKVGAITEEEARKKHWQWSNNTEEPS